MHPSSSAPLCKPSRPDPLPYRSPFVCLTIPWAGGINQKVKTKAKATRAPLTSTFVERKKRQRRDSSSSDARRPKSSTGSRDKSDSSRYHRDQVHSHHCDRGQEASLFAEKFVIWLSSSTSPRSLLSTFSPWMAYAQILKFLPRHTLKGRKKPCRMHRIRLSDLSDHPHHQWRLTTSSLK